MNNVATIPAAQAIRAELYSVAMRNEFERALPDPKMIDRFIRIVWTTVSRNPDLLNADRRSLFSSCMDAAQLGLVVDGVLGEAYLAVFKGKVQLIVGYRGMLKLVRQSGEISTVDVDTIHENDKVVMIGGDQSKFEIEMNWADRGEIIGAYAIAHFKDGGRQRAVMNLAELEKIRKAAFSGNSPAWRNNVGEMYKKTVFKRVAKMLPLSTEARKAVAMDDAVETGSNATLDGDSVVTDAPVDATTAPRQRRSRLNTLANAEAVDVPSDPIDPPQDNVPPPTEEDVM